VHHVLHECVVGRPILSSMFGHVPIYHRGVGIDFPLQSCCCLCYVIQPVDHLLHECVVGCHILSSMYEHVPIYHLIFLDSTPSYTLCTLTSHHRVRLCSGLYQLAKHHWHVTNAPCKALQKSRRGRYCFICLSVCLFVLSSWMISVRDKISHVLTERAWVRGVGIEFVLQSCRR